MKGGVDVGRQQRASPCVPFDSANKFMATLNEGPDGSRAILVKGAPDRLLERSRDAARRRRAPSRSTSCAGRRAIDELGGAGAARAGGGRAGRSAADTDEIDGRRPRRGLEFLGLWGILDPPRPEAIEAIADCHAAGIRVKMITGDHAGTAVAIGREMGLVDRRRRRACSPAPSSRR